jgi:hypothetical protein
MLIILNSRRKVYGAWLSAGMLEYWNDGTMGQWTIITRTAYLEDSVHPAFQYSNLPLFRLSLASDFLILTPYAMRYALCAMRYA